MIDDPRLSEYSNVATYLHDRKKYLDQQVEFWGNGSGKHRSFMARRHEIEIMLDDLSTTESLFGRLISFITTSS